MLFAAELLTIRQSYLTYMQKNKNYRELEHERLKGKKTYQERVQQEVDAQLQIDAFYSEEEEEDEDDRDPWATPTYPNSY